MPDPLDPYASPYLLQPPQQPHWTESLGSLLTNLGAGIAMASASGRPWAAGIAPGLAMGSNALSQQQAQAEQEAIRRTQLAMQMAAFQDKRDERAQKQAAIEGWVTANAPGAQPGFNVATDPVKMGPQPANQDEFVRMMTPHALAVSQATGLDPRLVIAQSALETNWGKAAPGNNYFGIKSHGRPGGQDLATNEVGAGGLYRTTDSFRTYQGPAQSAQDYAEFLRTNGRYAPVLQAKGLDAQIDAMGKSGYATDPAYGAKLRQIAGGLPAPGGPVIAQGDSVLGPGVTNGPPPADAPPEPPSVPRPMLPAPEAAYLANAVRAGILTPQQAEAEKMRLIGDLWKRQQDEALARYNQANENFRFSRGQKAEADRFERSQKAEQDREQRRLQTEGDYVTGPDGVARFVPKSERKAGDTKFNPPTGYRVKEDGSGMEFIPGGPADPAVTKKSSPMNNEQARDAGFADRMQNSTTILDKLDTQGTKFWQSLGDAKVLGVPLPGGNYLQSPEYQQYKQAKEDFINAQLRRESGAAISQSEFDKADRQYFPQPGDSAAVIEQKRKNRQLAVEGMIRGAGPSYTPSPSIGPQPAQGGGDQPSKPAPVRIDLQGKRL